MKPLLVWLGLAAAFAVNATGLGEPLVFTGMCDASAAVALDTDLFAAANDEDNMLRFYRLSQPGKPVQTCNLNRLLFGKKKSPEMDIEAAARLGPRVFWITSHGRDTAGKPAPDRGRLFALEFTLQGPNVEVKPVGRVYTNLVADLAREPKLARFRLGEAAKLSAKEADGFNIEALTDTPDGMLLIGFRSPVPEGRALLVPLLNPDELLTGQPPRFGEPILLNLGGLGLRGMDSTKDGYYLIAGPDEEKAESRLYFWPGGMAEPKPLAGVSFTGVNPEGICFHDATERADFLVLSDDGNRKLGGRACRDLPKSQRQFRVFRTQK